MNEELPKALRCFIDEHLTADEKRQIVDQIYGHSLRNRQVLWTGMAREDAQSWADKHDLQTLTTAMGPLMDNGDARCPHRKKGIKGWTRYVLGASAIFAWYISKGDLVTVLTHPPPDLFHPSGLTSYQVIEEPILKGMLGNRAVGRIELVHPSVPKATVLRYQIWPKDESYRWKPKSHAKIPDAKWRQVKLCGPPRGFEVVCGLGVSDKASGKRVNKPNAPEHYPNFRNTILSGSKRQHLKALESEQSKAREKLQQQQCQAWKQLLNQQSQEKKSTQKKYSDKLSAVPLQRETKKQRQELQQACRNKMRRLRKKHNKLKVESHTSDDKALRELKRSQTEELAALKKSQARERPKASKANPETPSNLIQQHLRTGEIPTSKPAKKRTTAAKLKGKQNGIARFEKEQQERAPNSGLDKRAVANPGQAFFISLLMAGCEYVVESLMYLTQYSSSSY